MSKNVKPAVIGVATSLITPITALAYDQVSNNDIDTVVDSSNFSRAIKSMDKAGVVTGVAENDYLNVRSQSNSGSSLVGKYSNGETVIITGQDSNGWYKVDFEGKTGYVHNNYVRITGDISFPKTTANLNLRWGPSTNNGIIKTIPNGTVVRLISSSSNGWSKIYSGGDIGFVSSEYLSKTSGNSGSSNTGGSSTSESIQSLNKLGEVVGVASNDTLNIRSQSNSDSSIVGKMSNGTKVHVTGKASNGWYRVNYNGVVGFVNNRYIKILGDYNTAPTPTGTRKTTENLNFRTGPSTSYSKIMTIPNGAVVDYYSESNGWAKVGYAGKIGYVSTKYLTTNSGSNQGSTNTDIESMSATGKVVKTSDFLNVRSQPNADSSILGKVYPNNTVTITGKDKKSGWYRINFNGSSGYVSNYYIELVNPNSTTKKITTANVNFRTGPGTNYSIIKTVASNTVVEVISSSNGWSKVKVGGQTGYMSDTYLKAYDGSSSGGGSSLPSSKPSYSKIKVVVDAGHGGHDPGAVGNGRREKDIVLSISKKVNSKLKSLGFQTIMTRSTDTYITLSERYSIANRNNADMFVSIHANSGPSSASGIETLYKNYKTFANDIQNGMINETGAKSRGLKYRTDLAVLNGTKMPSALVEIGFISNSSESSKIGNDSYQEKLANGIVKGIAKYADNNIRK